MNRDKLNAALDKILDVLQDAFEEQDKGIANRDIDKAMNMVEALKR